MTTKHCPLLRQFISSDSTSVHGSLIVSSLTPVIIIIVVLVVVVMVLRPRRRDPPPPRRRSFGLLVGLVLVFLRPRWRVLLVVVSSPDTVDDITMPKTAGHVPCIHNIHIDTSMRQSRTGVFCAISSSLGHK